MDFREIFKEKTLKTKYRHFVDEMHIEYTTPNHICNCNKKAYEKIDKSKTENKKN